MIVLVITISNHQRYNDQSSPGMTVVMTLPALTSGAGIFTKDLQSTAAVARCCVHRSGKTLSREVMSWLIHLVGAFDHYEKNASQPTNHYLILAKDQKNI